MTGLRNAFWVLAIFALGMYAFFVALGARAYAAAAFAARRAGSAPPSA